MVTYCGNLNNNGNQRNSDQFESGLNLKPAKFVMNCNV